MSPYVALISERVIGVSSRKPMSARCDDGHGVLTNLDGGPTVPLDGKDPTETRSDPCPTQAVG